MMREYTYSGKLPSRSFRQDISGVTALEFALISPVLILLMFATIELSLIMFAQGTMESATFNASRLGKTGYTATGVSRQQSIINMISNRTSGLLDASKITITAKAYSQFTQVGQPEPFTDTNRNGVRDSNEAYTDSNGNGRWDADMGQAGLGNAGDVVLYTVNYPWKLLTPVMNKFIGTNGVVTLSVRTVVKNEPWQN